MCRMVGFSAAKPVKIGPFLRAVAHQAQHGCRPWGRPHGDGWGLAVLTPSGWFVAHSNRPIWEFPLETIAELEATSGLVHARLASPNTPVNLVKVHPFCAVLDGRTFAFCHNGSITRCDRLPQPRHVMLPPNAIDTEHYFALVQDRIFNGDTEEAALAETIKVAVKHECEASSLNALLLSDKKLVAAKGPVDQNYQHYYTLYVHQTGELTAVSTEPLTGFGVGNLLEDVLVAETGRITTRRPL